MSLVTSENCQAVLRALRRCADPVVDTETTGTEVYYGDHIIGASICLGDAQFYFPFAHLHWLDGLPLFEGTNKPVSNLPPSALEDLCASLGPRQTGFNYKFDLAVFGQTSAFALPDKIQDVILAAHLVNENEEGFSLEHLGAKYLGAEAVRQQVALRELLKKRGLKKNQMNKLSPEEVDPYACEDVRVTRALREYYKPRLRKQDLFDLWEEGNHYALVIHNMESRGFLMDTQAIQRNLAVTKAGAAQSLQVLHVLAGKAINPGSPKQICEWLDIDSSARDSDDMKALVEAKDPRVMALLEWRQWYRAQTVYYQAFADKVEKSGGTLHPNIKLHGTVAGRPSCNDPNLQAIPASKTIAAYAGIKGCFLARPGMVLVSADYSQAEMRLACHYGNEKTMGGYLASGADAHGETAKDLGIERYYAKRINFSVIYGVGAETLGKNLGIPTRTAKKFLNRYHRKYSGFKRLYRQAEGVAKKRGFIKMFTGRRRHFNHKWRSPPHKASSNLVQGGVAEIMRIASCRLAEMEGVHQLLHVHDQIVFEVPAGREDLIREAKRRMEDFPQFYPPMKVDVGVGPSWGQLTDWVDPEEKIDAS
jgi:DNA polymerase I